jgi:DDE superfamily endonuclease
VALAGFPLRRQALGVCGRERLSHVHDTALRTGAQSTEGLRQGSEKPRQEHYADRIHQPRRSHGRVDGCRGSHRRFSLRGLCGEYFLAPTLKEGQVVVLDGLGAHRTEKVRELIEGRGADFLFLPSYSPDLNPIEEAFSKIKSIVRKVGARTREALVEAIERALAAVTPEEATGWFAHAGYEPQYQSL